MSELRRKEIDNMTPEEWAAERASNDAFVKKYLDTRSIFDWKPQNEGSGKGWDHRQNLPQTNGPRDESEIIHYSFPNLRNRSKGENFLREDYIKRHWEPTDEEKEQSRLHSQVSGQSATVPPAIAEQRLKEKFEKTLLAQNPSFDIGAGHRGASRNAKIHNLTRNNPNLKEVEAARHILGGVNLPTF